MLGNVLGNYIAHAFKKDDVAGLVYFFLALLGSVLREKAELLGQLPIGLDVVRDMFDDLWTPGDNEFITVVMRYMAWVEMVCMRLPSSTAP
jgi:hypothetical protein